jgi:hypothetical protein
MSGDMFAFGRLCLSVGCSSVPASSHLIKIFQVYTRLAPFHTIFNDMAVFRKVFMNEQPPRPTLDECHDTAIPDKLWELIIRCWNVTPEDRPTVFDARTELNKIDF